MKFFELLRKYSNEQIIESLHKNYGDIVDEAYLFALNELRELKPSEEKQDIEINVKLEKDDLDKKSDKMFLVCNGIGPDENGRIETWALEFSRWEQWLAKDIYSKCLEQLDELTILAGIMWELTYNGYTQSDVDERRNDLEERIKEVEEHPENLKTLNIEELKKSLLDEE